MVSQQCRRMRSDSITSCLWDSCRCHTSISRPAAKFFQTQRLTRSNARRAAICAASISILIFPIGSPRVSSADFLTSHPELGDISQGQLLTIKNYYRLVVGILTPVQIEGLRLLLTPFPQEEFNQTEDRKSADQSLGVTCLDCHANFHTDGAFHQPPDVRPQAARFRLDTASLRGLFNQQIHGSKRSLRSVEDFTQFEQRTAYFNGDHVSAQRKGVNLPDRFDQVPMMAQRQRD